MHMHSISLSIRGHLVISVNRNALLPVPAIPSKSSQRPALDSQYISVGVNHDNKSLYSGIAVFERG